MGTPKESRYWKVLWKQLQGEGLQPGDMWASVDPNTPERQGEKDFNLQLQAVHPSRWGAPAKQVTIGNGGFWRPVDVIDAVRPIPEDQTLS